MSLPFSGSANIGGFSILPSEVSLVTALGSAGVSTSSTFKIDNSSVYFVAVLASGQVTMAAKTDSATPISNPASGGDTTSVTLVGAGTKGFIRLDSTSSNVYSAVRLTDANWSSALSSLDILVLTQRPAANDFYWFTTDSMENGGAVVVSTLPR